MAQYKDNLLGEANSFLEVLEQVSRLAPLDKPVLVIGERGTGKELIANRLHYLSSRWQGPTLGAAAPGGMVWPTGRRKACGDTAMLDARPW